MCWQGTLVTEVEHWMLNESRDWYSRAWCGTDYTVGWPESQATTRVAVPYGQHCMCS